MEHERTRAKLFGKESPVYANKSLTDASYHLCLEHLITQVHDHNSSLMVATHNKETVQRAMELMKKHEIPVDDKRVLFGQIIGMGDHLMFPMAHAGYNAIKVVAYGSLDNTVAFLARRGIENRGIMKNAQEERKIYSQELRRRFYRYTRGLI